MPRCGDHRHQLLSNAFHIPNRNSTSALRRPRLAVVAVVAMAVVNGRLSFCKNLLELQAEHTPLMCQVLGMAQCAPLIAQRDLRT